MQEVKKILVIRFRQIGDAVLATALCNTLKQSFPEAEIHFVLNKAISPLFEHHPAIDKIITFDKEENKKTSLYFSKVWRVTHAAQYDVIIDMRSTIRTLLFSLFSLHTPIRIGRAKWYSRFLHNNRIDNYNEKLSLDMVKRNQMLIAPLEKIRQITYTDKFDLGLSDKERTDFRTYMEIEGINFQYPVLLIGVTTKLEHKKWNVTRMTELLHNILSDYSTLQLIFNYAPGEEEKEAKQIYQNLGSPQNIFINIEAGSLRELIALCSNSSLYFGNEGGARHIAQAMNIPSFAIYSPNSSKSTWLPQNSTQAEGIDPSDIISSKKLHSLSYEEQFSLLTVEEVYKRLKPLLDRL